jgi:hypothetical protein
MATSIQKHMIATFISLRIGIGVIGIIFPFLLWGGGKMAGFHLADSMSAYYHANNDCIDPKQTEKAASCAGLPDPPRGTGPMRNWFVGILFIIGAVMYLIKGFSWQEDWLLNVAGVAAILVALFPMSWTSAKGRLLAMHGGSAMVFFCCIFLVCWHYSGTTLKHFPGARNDPERVKVIARYRFFYRLLAVVMLLSPAAAWVLNTIGKQNSYIFYVETVGICSFGFYWLLKTFELKRSGVEYKALEGTIDMHMSDSPTQKMVAKVRANMSPAAG